MSYNVGQILFVVLNKKNQVYPMLVVEEIVKRTLRGEETNYVLQGGSDPSSRLMLDQVDGDIFNSAEEARNVLVSKATSQIEKLVLAAKEKAKEWYTSSHDENVVHELPIKNEGQVVKLPDGTVARVRLPETA
jgi:hypothetical protein